MIVFQAFAKLLELMTESAARANHRPDLIAIDTTGHECLAMALELYRPPHLRHHLFRQDLQLVERQ